MFPDQPPPLPLPLPTTSNIPQSDQENQFFLPICLVLTAKLTQESFSLTKAACQAPRLVNCKNSTCQTQCPVSVQIYKLEKEMQREERISRQWPPSEIAMENGNTMIPPVARSPLVRGPWGVNNAISIKYKLQQVFREFRTIIPVISHSRS